MFFKILFSDFLSRRFKKNQQNNEIKFSSVLNECNFDKTDELTYKYKRGIEVFIDWKNFSKHLNFNDHIDIIIHNAEHLDWSIISCNSIVLEYDNDDFLEKCMFLFRNHINWYYFCMYNDIPEDLLEKYINYIDINQTCKYQKLSKKFCRVYKDILNYQLLLNFQESLWDRNMF